MSTVPPRKSANVTAAFYLLGGILLVGRVIVPSATGGMEADAVLLAGAAV